jgi:uncharacterized membrane protein YhaH (DUF805 family)
VILLVNIFAGWTGIGWVAILIWASWPRAKSLADPILSNPTGLGARNVGHTLGEVDGARQVVYEQTVAAAPGTEPSGANFAPVGEAYRQPPRTKSYGFFRSIGDFYGRYFRDGRSGRAQFWWAVLGLILLSMLVGGIAGAWLHGSVDSQEFRWVTVAFWVVNIPPWVALSVRRLHDIGKSGKWFLVTLIPLGILVIFFWALRPGIRGPNEYGPDPLAA